MTIGDGLIFFVFLFLTFLLGRGYVMFLRLLSREKQDPSAQQSVVNKGIYIAPMGVGYHLIVAALTAYQHNTEAMQRSLVMVAVFTSMFLGAWVETNHSRSLVEMHGPAGREAHGRVSPHE